jgi:inosine/xanthosine triphosphate pyrophosphatase family protein
VPEYAATMAQLGPEIKNRISHRAQALAAFKTLLRSWLQAPETGGCGSLMAN